MTEYRNKYRVVYTVKNESGFIVDRSKQFPTFTDAKVFVQLLREGGKLVGRPCFEIRGE